ncbi:hypothetical protein OG203_06255 [Nocardia sp. NBC_01499]|uniref:hypothetical protein n=1 Tax=Nocardia sp. NBC_01499 TaxID=2903597 RepID=UPI00386ACA28
MTPIDETAAAIQTMLRAFIGPKPAQPLLRFADQVDDDPNFIPKDTSHPDPAPADGWSGGLPSTPPPVTGDNVPGYRDGIHAQPGWGTRSQSWLRRREFETFEEATVAAFEFMPMARRFFQHFSDDNNGTALKMHPREVDEGIFHTKWGLSTLFYGQDVALQAVPHGVDPRSTESNPMMDYFTVPGYQYDPDHPDRPNAQFHQNGILDAVNEKVKYRQAHPGENDLPFTVGWMRTPYDWQNQDNDDVSNALGHFWTGASGTIHFNDDGTYAVRFTGNVWKHYKFDTRIPLPDDGNDASLKIAMNNRMREAQGAGVGQNFIAYGSTIPMIATGSIVNGHASSDFAYYPEGDPNESRQVHFPQDRYDVLNKPREDHSKDYWKPLTNLFKAHGGEISRGDVKGQGSSIGDKIPAYLSDGEFVVSAASASANRPLLKAINDDPLYMTKYVKHVEQAVAAALTKVRAVPSAVGEQVDQSMTVHISAYDVHEAFAKAKLWQQRHDLVDTM